MLHEFHARSAPPFVVLPFAAIIVVLLALGIGTSSAMFSAVNTVLLRPLPYPAADRLVAIYEANARQHDLD